MRFFSFHCDYSQAYLDNQMPQAMTSALSMHVELWELAKLWYNILLASLLSQIEIVCSTLLSLWEVLPRGPSLSPPSSVEVPLSYQSRAYCSRPCRKQIDDGHLSNTTVWSSNGGEWPCALYVQYAWSYHSLPRSPYCEPHVIFLN